MRIDRDLLDDTTTIPPDAIIRMTFIPSIFTKTLCFKGIGELSDFMVESNFVVHDLKPSKENMRNVCEPFTLCAPLKDMVFQKETPHIYFKCLGP